MPTNDQLKAFAENAPLVAAVKEILLQQFSFDGINTSLSNEQMGEIVRAKTEGLKAVEEAFREIEKYKTPPPPVERLNRAR